MNNEPGRNKEKEPVGILESMRRYLDSPEENDPRDTERRAFMELVIKRSEKLEQVTPLTYLLVTDSIMYDSFRGVDGFTGEPMPEALTDTAVAATLHSTAAFVAKDLMGSESDFVFEVQDLISRKAQELSGE